MFLCISVCSSEFDDVHCCQCSAENLSECVLTHQPPLLCACVLFIVKMIFLKEN